MLLILLGWKCFFYCWFCLPWLCTFAVTQRAYFMAQYTQQCGSCTDSANIKTSTDVFMCWFKFMYASVRTLTSGVCNTAAFCHRLGINTDNTGLLFIQFHIFSMSAQRSYELMATLQTNRIICFWLAHNLLLCNRVVCMENMYWYALIN